MTNAAQAIVVLGGGVHPDGSLPLMVQHRVARAVELYRRRVAPRLILSGRCSLRDADPPPVTEAAAMADLALALGVPASRILLEERSKDTLGNAYFTRIDHLEPNEWTRIRVVTSDFHLSRAAWVFRKILGPEYDFSFVSAFSGFSPRELIHRALEEVKIYIFLNEWLERVEEGDEHAIDHLMEHVHPGYAEAPHLPAEELLRRIEEIARITRIAGTQRWLAGEEVGAAD